MRERRPVWAMRLPARVLVCDNLNIVTIAVDRLGRYCSQLICTDRMPGAAQRALLSQLATAGERLWYHGDFDWPGIGMANLVLREHSARQWRMSARRLRGRHQNSIEAGSFGWHQGRRQLGCELT